LNVPSYEFLAFALCAAVAINLSDAPNWRRMVFLVANVLFVLSFTRDPAQLAPFAAFILAGFLSVKLMETRRRRTSFIFLIVTLTIAFCFLKRYSFLPHTLFIPFAYLTVGISYVFFRILHLTIDAFEDSLPERIGILSYINYTLNFTSLVSGPIQLYADYRRSESVKPLALDWPAVGWAVNRIVVGFFKVAVMSPVVLFIQQRCTELAAGQGTLEGRPMFAALMMTLFPVYLYFNFSGYTDFVIGVARFMKLGLPENFNKPFFATGFIDFWTRWHMSLSNWVKTYIYSPLFMSLMRRWPSPRVEPWLGVIAYFVAFFFIGVWHGQTSMFVFFGVLLGLGVSLNKLYQIVMIRRLGRLRYRELSDGRAYSTLSRGLTWAWFSFSSLWFWSSWDQLAHFERALGVAGTAASLSAMWGGTALVLAAWKALYDWIARATASTLSVAASRYVAIAWCTALAVVVLSVTVVLNAPAPQIVYKAF